MLGALPRASRRSALAFSAAGRDEGRAPLLTGAASPGAQGTLREALRAVEELEETAALTALLSGTWRAEPGERTLAGACDGGTAWDRLGSNRVRREEGPDAGPEPARRCEPSGDVP